MNGLPPQTIPILPVGCQVHVAQAQLPNGDIMVALTIDDVTGRRVTFLTADQAVTVGAAVTKLGEAGRLLVAAKPPPAPGQPFKR